MKAFLVVFLVVLFDGLGADACACSREHDPVCGENGHNYVNSCWAECAGQSYTDGACPEVYGMFEGKRNSDCAVTADLNPVCGSNDVEYDNPSAADCAGVEYTMGPCPDPYKNLKKKRSQFLSRFAGRALHK